MLKNFLSSFVPFENKRLTSWISLTSALILLGFFGKIGEKILDGLLGLIAPFSPEIFKYIKIAANYTISVNLITIIIFVLLFFPIYRFFDKKLLGGLKRVTVFEDNFDFGNKGWLLNYWGSNNPDKTCRIENSNIVFEAENEDLLERKENGAYYDLTNGIYQDCRYEISCWVKSSPGTTMGFKLWVHDTRGHGQVKSPANFYTPGEKYEEVKVGFTGTQSLGLRIHLHYKPGKGTILINEVKVIKIG